MGDGPTRCFKCAHVKSGTTCVAACAPLEQVNADSICSPCHEECLSGCFVPADEAQCSGTRRCRNVVDAGRCVVQCPSDKPFLYNRGDNECRQSCPFAAPYFNDTRAQGSDVITMGQQCVSQCSEFDDVSRIYIDETAPRRCTTQARIEADNPGGNDLGRNMTIVAGVVGGVAAIILIVAIIVVIRQRSRNAVLSISNGRYMCPGRGLSPSSARAGSTTPSGDYNARYSMVFDPVNFDMTHPTGEALQLRANDSGYLDVKPIPGTAGSHGYTGHKQLYHSTADDVSFTDSVESTHM